MPPPPVAAAPREPAQTITPEAQERLQRATAAPLDEANASEALLAVLEPLHLRFGARLRYDSESQSLTAALRLPAKGVGRAPHVLTQPIAAPARDEGVRDRAMLTARISELESLVESLRRTATGSPTSAQAERRVAELTRERDRYKS